MTSRLRIYEEVPFMEIHVRKTLKDAVYYTVVVNVIAVRQARRPLKAVN